MDDTTPIACTLDPRRMPQRGDEIRRLGRDGLLATEPGERSVTLRFRSEPAIREQLDRIVAAESACCAFLDFALEEEPGATVLTIEAPEGGEWAAHGLAYLFSGG
jgi:hypothetical protein